MRLLILCLRPVIMSVLLATSLWAQDCSTCGGLGYRQDPGAERMPCDSCAGSEQASGSGAGGTAPFEIINPSHSSLTFSTCPSLPPPAVELGHKLVEGQSLESWIAVLQRADLAALGPLGAVAEQYPETLVAAAEVFVKGVLYSSFGTLNDPLLNEMSKRNEFLLSLMNSAEGEADSELDEQAHCIVLNLGAGWMAGSSAMLVGYAPETILGGGCLRLLQLLGPAALPALARGLERGDDYARFNILCVVKSLGPAAAPASCHVAELLLVDWPGLNNRALETLSAIGPGAAGTESQVAAFLVRTPGGVQALETLAQLGPRLDATFGAIAPYLGDVNARYRNAALDCLRSARALPGQAVEVIVSLAGEQSLSVLDTIFEQAGGLPDIGSADAQRLLLLLMDGQASQRAGRLDLLSALFARAGAPTVVDAAAWRGAALALLEHPDAQVRLPALDDVLAHEHSAMEHRGRLLEATHADVRHAGVQLVGRRLGESSSYSELLLNAAILDVSPMVRLAATRALAARADEQIDALLAIVGGATVAGVEAAMLAAESLPLNLGSQTRWLDRLVTLSGSAEERVRAVLIDRLARVDSGALARSICYCKRPTPEQLSAVFERLEAHSYPAEARRRMHEAMLAEARTQLDEQLIRRESEAVVELLEVEALRADLAPAALSAIHAGLRSDDTFSWAFELASKLHERLSASLTGLDIQGAIEQAGERVRRSSPEQIEAILAAAEGLSLARDIEADWRARSLQLSSLDDPQMEARMRDYVAVLDGDPPDELVVIIFRAHARTGRWSEVGRWEKLGTERDLFSQSDAEWVGNSRSFQDKMERVARWLDHDVPIVRQTLDTKKVNSLLFHLSGSELQPDGLTGRVAINNSIPVSLVVQPDQLVLKAEGRVFKGFPGQVDLEPVAPGAMDAPYLGGPASGVPLLTGQDGTSRIWLMDLPPGAALLSHVAGRVMGSRPWPKVPGGRDPIDYLKMKGRGDSYAFDVDTFVSRPMRLQGTVCWTEGKKFKKQVQVALRVDGKTVWSGTLHSASELLPFDLPLAAETRRIELVVDTPKIRRDLVLWVGVRLMPE